jgi:GNAT superfamily N-acetyltransferase
MAHQMKKGDTEALRNDLILETEPRPEDIQFLEECLYEFNTQTTGIKDGGLFGFFLRAANGLRLGGVYGWTWGGTCYVRYLFVPEEMRRQGQGKRLMHAVEAEAKARKCQQIMLETYDFQAPGFYQKLGFDVIGAVADHPRGYRYLTLVKRLA